MNDQFYFCWHIQSAYFYIFCAESFLVNYWKQNKDWWLQKVFLTCSIKIAVFCKFNSPCTQNHKKGSNHSLHDHKKTHKKYFFTCLIIFLTQTFRKKNIYFPIVISNMVELTNNCSIWYTVLPLFYTSKRHKNSVMIDI